MTDRKTPVIAVIPHFNMPQTLVRLLSQILENDYDAVYVLDDHSTVCDIREVLSPFEDKVKLITGERNLGAACNRNRILEAKAEMPKGALLHFIDADCELQSQNVPDLARSIFSDNSVGLAGGLVINADGSQYIFNYSPRISWMWVWSKRVHRRLSRIAPYNPVRYTVLRRMLGSIMAHWPNLLAKPSAKDVFCVTEANMMIPFEVFDSVGGFDERLRYNEVQDLAYKLEARNLRRRFDPSITVRHLAIDVRGKSRRREKFKGALVIVRKYGMPLW